MVRFTPAGEFDPRSPEELFDDFNQIMPFPIDAGDFVVNAGMEGPSCWVSFGEGKRTRVLLQVLESTPAWQVSTIGSVRKDCRAMFGLSAKPGVYDEARINRMLAQNRAGSHRP